MASVSVFKSWQQFDSAFTEFEECVKTLPPNAKRIPEVRANVVKICENIEAIIDAKDFSFEQLDGNTQNTFIQRATKCCSTFLAVVGTNVRRVVFDAVFCKLTAIFHQVYSGVIREREYVEEYKNWDFPFLFLLFEDKLSLKGASHSSDAEFRKKAAEHLKIDLKVIDERHSKYQSKCHGIVSRGVCLGLTLARMCQDDPIECLNRTHRIARFMQAANNISKNSHFWAVLEKTGRKILEDPDSFPTILAHAARVLHFPEVKDLLAAYKEGNQAQKILRVIGKSVDSYKKIFASYLRRAKYCEMRLMDSQVSAQEKRDVKQAVRDLSKTQFEYFQIETLLEEMDPQEQCLDHMPAPILRAQGLSTSKIVMKNISMHDFSDAVIPLKDKEGQYRLSLMGNDELLGHSIYVSFKPPAFSDANNREDPLVLKPKFRSFKTSGKMLEVLKKRLDSKYTRDAFHLLQYEKMPSR